MERPETLCPVLVFALGSETYGVRLDAVREIAPAGDLQRVPRAPGLIRGLVDLRGRMVTALDLAVLTGGSAEGPDGFLLILAEPRDHLAFWSPAAIDLRSFDLAGLRARPGAEHDPDVFEGYVAGEAGVVNLLSTEKILLRCEQEVLKRYRVAS